MPDLQPDNSPLLTECPRFSPFTVVILRSVGIGTAMARNETAQAAQISNVFIFIISSLSVSMSGNRRPGFQYFLNGCRGIVHLKLAEGRDVSVSIGSIGFVAMRK